MEEEEVAITDAIEHGSSSVSVPLAQRVTAASAGALLTSLATNPLDVVKTRLQAQEAPGPRAAGASIPSACQEYYATMETVHGATLQYSRPTQGAAGEASAVAYQGTRDALVKIGRAEGLRGLYRGLAPSLAMAVPSTVLYYSLYDSLREAFHALGAGPIVAPLIGGSCSRVVAATATAPLELVRTRMQAEARAGGIGSTVGGMLSIVRGSGFLSLWHGLGAQLWRDVPFSAMYWLGYEQLAQALDQRDDEGQTSYMLKSFAAGAGAGMAAAFLTTPFDVIKTRRQVALPGDAPSAAAGGAAAAGGTAAAATALPRQPMPSMQTALRCVVATEGYQALFSGALPRTLRIGLACAIMISSYEGGKYLFLRTEKKRGAALLRSSGSTEVERGQKQPGAEQSSSNSGSGGGGMPSLPAAAASARATLPSR